MLLGSKRKFISDALDILVMREFPTRNQDYPEDVTVSRLALYLYGRKGVDVIEFQGGKYLIGIRTCDYWPVIKAGETGPPRVCRSLRTAGFL